MTNEPQVQEAAQRNRVTLNEESVSIIDGWMEQVGQLKALRIKRGDVVNWILKRHRKLLNAKELKTIAKEFSDDTSFTEWALGQIRSAKRQGQIPPTINELLSQRYVITGFSERKTRHSRKKTNDHQSNKQNFSDQNLNEISRSTEEKVL